MPSKTTPRRILIIRTDRMGDVILSTPVLTAFKESFPESHVAMMVRDYTRPLVEGHPDIDEILVDEPDGRFAGPGGFFRLVRLIRSFRFDTALVLHPSFRLALMCLLAGIKVRAGTAYRAYSFLFNKRIKLHRKKSGMHECDLNMRMASALGAHAEKVVFKIDIPDPAKASLAQKLKSRGLGSERPYIVIHPGSGGSALDWPPEKFAGLATKITKELKLPVVVTGSQNEKELVDKVAAQGEDNVFRLDGQLDTKELAALLQSSSLVIANSTGPLHLADAVGARVIGLYCPLQPCRPERWGPYSQLDSVIMPPISGCTQCKGNCSYHNCMELITVEKVFEAVKAKLRSINT